MSNKAEVQEKRLSRRESSVSPGELVDSRDSGLIDLGDKELLIVIGGRAAKPKVTIVVKPDGTIVVTQG
jgi:hypothetical protein